MPKIQFAKGYKEVREKVEKNVRYNRECNNCASFYKDDGDEEELCNDPRVLSYDICTEGNRIWCQYWRSMSEV